MKLLKRIGDSLFTISDRFFTGVTDTVTKPKAKNTGISTTEQVPYITWELNQGVDDIMLKDFSAIIRCLVPATLRRSIKQLLRDVFVFFMVDAFIDDAMENPEINPDVTRKIASASSEKKTIVFDHCKTGLKSKLVWMMDWLSTSNIKILKIKSSRTYYLLSDVSPALYGIDNSTSCYKPGKHNHFKFLPTCFYHKRN